MKKKIIITFIMLFAIGVNSNYKNVQAQIPVTDAANLGVNTVIQTLNTIANSISDWMALVKKSQIATEGLDAIQSISEIAGLIDDLACLTSEFQFLMNLNGQYTCASFLNFRLVTVNLGYSTNILKNVILVKNIFTMTSGERVNYLETVRKSLVEVIAEIKKINNTIRGHLNKRILKDSMKRNYFSKTQGITYRRI